MKRQEHIINGIIGTLILLWVYAAGSKLQDFNLFLAELGKQPLPGWTVPIAALILPLGETGTAVLLLFRRTAVTGLKLSSILMLLFTLYVVLAMTRTFGHIPCPCAGIIGRMPWGAHLVFNIFFLSISCTGYFLRKHD